MSGTKIAGKARLAACAVLLITACGASKRLGKSASAAAARSNGIVTIPFSKLRGSGSFSAPFVIGPVTAPTMIVGCPRLTAGRPYNNYYFSFSLRSTASAKATAGAVVNLTPDAMAAAHPRLATQDGVTLLTSSSDGRWLGDPNSPGQVGRFLPLRGLPAGAYRLGVEKLASPLRSLQTPGVSLVIIP